MLKIALLLKEETKKEMETIACEGHRLNNLKYAICFQGRNSIKVVSIFFQVYIKGQRNCTVGRALA